MAKKIKTAADGFNEILLYTTPNGKVKMEIYLQNETIWLTQQKIADLFWVDRSVVTKHLINIYNWIKKQLVQKLHKFKLKVTDRFPDLLSTITLMPLFPWVTE